MVLRFHVLAAVAGTLLICLCVPGPVRGQALDSVAIPETDLVVDLPRSWSPGGFRGLGILLSYLGGGDGYPRFTVQHDPEASLPESATLADAERAVEDLFEELVEIMRGSEVLDAGWTEVNGIRAHRSTVVWDSVAGSIQGRRLILVHRGRPLVLAWVDRRGHFPEIADLVRDSMASLRRGGSGPVVDR